MCQRSQLLPLQSWVGHDPVLPLKQSYWSCILIRLQNWLHVRTHWWNNNNNNRPNNRKGRSNCYLRISRKSSITMNRLPLFYLKQVTLVQCHGPAKGYSRDSARIWIRLHDRLMSWSVWTRSQAWCRKGDLWYRFRTIDINARHHHWSMPPLLYACFFSKATTVLQISFFLLIFHLSWFKCEPCTNYRHI